MPRRSRSPCFDRSNNVWRGMKTAELFIMQFCQSSCRILPFLSVYGSTALVEFGRFFSFLIYTQSAGLLGRGISPSQGHCLHTEQHKRRINEHRHPCLEWDSNPRSQCSRRRRWLVTAAARVQTRVWSCEILWWTKVALGQVFSENFGFPCQSTFYLLLHNHLHYHPRLAQ
jgi:hypothetical protein